MSSTPPMKISHKWNRTYFPHDKEDNRDDFVRSKSMEVDFLCSDMSEKTGSLPNLPGFPGHGLLFSPRSRRRRSHNLSKVQLNGLVGTSLPKTIPHLPRDPTQPSSGSISDVHSNVSVDDEELDFFPGDNSFRKRSQTCPENRNWQRKVKSRNRSRPLTPPPGDVEDQEMISQMSKIAIKEKLHIHSYGIPLCIPEKDLEENSVEDIDENQNLELNRDAEFPIFDMDD